MDLNLRGKRALVLGGTSGIGLAIAQGLAGEGADLVIVSRHESSARQARKSIDLEDGQLLQDIQQDLSDPDGPQRAVDLAADIMSGLDILINNVPAPGFGLFESHDDDDWQAALDGKLLAYGRSIRAALPHFRQSDGGVVANVIGTGGKRYVPNHIAGGAGNAGLMLLTVGLAKELGRSGIRVVGISPGATASPRLDELVEDIASSSGQSAGAIMDDMRRGVPTGQIPTTTDVANVVTFLVSDAARQVNGTIVTVDGGAQGCL